MADKTRIMIEASPASRYRLKAVASLRGITIKELVEQTARELADGAGVKLPTSIATESTNATAKSDGGNGEGA